jgi:Ca-activated chloride channel family protein
MVAASLIFASPWWLTGLPLLVAGAVAFWRFSRRQAERRIALFVSPGSAREAVPSMDRRGQMLRFALPVAVAGLVCVALARPLTGPKPGHAERKGVDFVVALDVSKSMWAEDVPPNRLDAVKNELTGWMRQASGDRMGLVLFAGEALISAPVTFDFQALERVLKAASPRSISKGGTNIPKAIEMATTLLDKSGLDTRALVIFTDGENLDGDAVAAAREAHAKNGLTIFTVGVGSAAGAKVPQLDHAEFAKLKPPQQQRRGYVRNEYGTEVVSRLDEQALRAIATAGGGRFEVFVPGSGFFQNLRDTALLPLAKNRRILNVQDYYEWFPVPLVLAILLLMLEPLIPAVRKRGPAGVGVAVVRPETLSGPAGAPVSFARPKGKGVPTALLAFVLLPAALAVSEPGREVAGLLKDGKPAEAVAVMRAALDAAPSDPVLAYNYGLTLYQAGKLEDAIEVFQNLKTSTTEEHLRAKALFQLGNAQFRLAEKLGTQSGAVLSMERSLAFYDELLAVRSTGDARTNREAAKEALQEILTKIAAERLKSADDMEKRSDTARLSRVLQEALDAQERLTTLDPKDKQAAAAKEEIRRRLAESLQKDAEKHIAETDKIEAKNDKNADRQVLGRREQGIEILRQAQTQAPHDEKIGQKIQAEQTKMSNLITKRAEEAIAPALAKEKMSGGEMGAVEKGRQELAKALELDANNTRAKDLKAKADARLEDELLGQAEKNLAAVERQTGAQAKLRAASAAGEQFQKARDVNPDSQRARDGLAKVEAMLPDLHAAAAALDLAEAQKLLRAEGKSQNNLKKAVGYLETSTQNFSRSLALRPEDQKAQQGFEQAQQLLSESRDQLDAQRQAGAEQNESSDPAADPSAQPGEPAPPKMQIYNQRPTGKPAAPTGSFWDKNNRDW